MAVREMIHSPNVLVVKRLGYAASLAAISVVLMACGGGDGDVVSTTSDVAVSTVTTVNETTTTIASTEISEAVFGALSEGSINALSQVSALVTPGSPADILVRHQLSVAAFAVAADAEIAAAPTTSSTIVESTMSEVMDATSSTTTAELGCEWTNTCTIYDAPVFDNEGLLRSFSVNGVPLEQIVIGPGPLAVVESVQARVVSGYQAPSGVTAIIISVTAGEESLTTFGFAAIQRPLTNESAASIETAGAWGADQISSGQSGELLLVFPGTPLDGDVVFSVVTSSSIDLELELPLISP